LRHFARNQPLKAENLFKFLGELGTNDNCKFLITARDAHAFLEDQAAWNNPEIPFLECIIGNVVYDYWNISPVWKNAYFTCGNAGTPPKNDEDFRTYLYSRAILLQNIILWRNQWMVTH